MFFPHPRVKVSIVGSLRDREIACSASDRQGSNFESCVWRTVSSHSSHHPQEVLLAQFSLYVHKRGLKPDSFHFLACCKSYMFYWLFWWISISWSHNSGVQSWHAWEKVFIGTNSRWLPKNQIYPKIWLICSILRNMFSTMWRSNILFSW